MDNATAIERVVTACVALGYVGPAHRFASMAGRHLSMEEVSSLAAACVRADRLDEELCDIELASRAGEKLTPERINTLLESCLTNGATDRLGRVLMFVGRSLTVDEQRRLVVACGGRNLAIRKCGDDERRILVYACCYTGTLDEILADAARIGRRPSEDELSVLLHSFIRSNRLDDAVRTAWLLP